MTKRIALAVAFVLAFGLFSFVSAGHEGLPDFQVSAAQIDNIALDFTVRNDGGHYFGDLVTRMVWLDESNNEVAGTAREFRIFTNMPTGDTYSRHQTAGITSRPDNAVTVRLDADPAGAITESDESNNRREAVPGYRDFTVEDVDLTGDDVTFTLRNLGNMSFSGTLHYRLVWLRSDDTEISNNGDQSYSASLSAGGTQSRTHNNLLFIADEPDDAAKFRVTVNPPDRPSPRAESDLTNNSFDYVLPNPDFDLEAGEIRGNGIRFTVRNIGDAGFYEDLPVSFTWLSESGEELSSATESFGVSLTVSGGTAVVTRTFTDSFATTPPADARKVRVRANPEGSVAETSTANNSLDIEFPDFTVTAASFSAATVPYTFRNNGASFIGSLARRVSWLDADHAELSSISFSGTVTMGADASLSQTLVSLSGFYSSPPLAGRYLRITLNPDNAIGETDNGNNSIEIARPLPDLIIENPAFTGAGFRFRVSNSGTANWNTTVSRRFVWLRADRSEISVLAQTGTSANLDAGEGINLIVTNEFFTDPPEDAAFLRLGINHAHSIAEANFDNSTADFAVPDFVAENGTLTDGAGLSYTVRNAGSTRFEGLFPGTLTWLSASGGELTSESVGSSLTLDPGASSVVTRSGTFVTAAPAGAERLRIRLDSGNDLAESDNNNNDLIVERPKPDFAAEAVSLTYDRLTYRLRNVGARAYSGSLPMKFSWFSGESSLAEYTAPISIILLISGSSERILDNDFIHDPPEGATTLRITVNPENTVAEISAGNNTADIAPSYPDFSVDTPVLGATTISYSLTNYGGDFSGLAERRFEWLDGTSDVLGSHEITGLLIIDAGDSASLTLAGAGDFVIARPAAAARLRVTINQNYNIPETDFANNSAETVLITEETTAEDLAEADEEQAVADLAETEDDDAGTPAPKTRLPGGIGYTLRNFGREIKIALTFNPASKASARLDLANEKLLEADALLDAGKTESAVRHLGAYQKNLEAFNKHLQKAAQKGGVENLAKSAVPDTLNQQIVLGKFERLAGDSDNLEKARAAAAAVSGRTAAKAGNEKEVSKIISEALKSVNPLGALRSAEILKSVKTADKGLVNPALLAAEQRALDQFRVGLEAMPPGQQKLLGDYVDRAGGNKARHLETLRQVEAKVVNPEAKKELGQARRMLRQAGVDPEGRELRAKLAAVVGRLKALREQIISEEARLKAQAAEVKGAKTIASLIVNTNTSAINAQRQLSETTAALGRVFERISAGLRINNAGDDAAGLSVSERLPARIRSLDQAIRNTEDATSLTDTAEGALDEVGGILVRMRELADQSASGTYSDAARASINTEFADEVDEITRIAAAATFDGLALLDVKAAGLNFQVGAGDGTERVTDFAQHLAGKQRELRDLMKNVIVSAEAEERAAKALLADLRAQKTKPAALERKDEKKEAEQTEEKKTGPKPAEKVPAKETPENRTGEPVKRTEPAPAKSTEPAPSKTAEPAKEITSPVSEPVKETAPAPEPTKAAEPTATVTKPVSLPDLIQSSTVSPQSAVAGNAMTFTAQVRNQGTGSAGSSTTRLRIDIASDGKWDLTYTAATGALAGGASETEAWRSIWIAVAGGHKYEICADSASAVSESDEADNCSTESFSVAAASKTTTKSLIEAVKGLFIRAR